MKSPERSFLEFETSQPQFQYDIIFLRHGERPGIEDTLTEKGREASREFGKSVTFEKIAGRFSDTKRTKETIEEIYSTIPSETKLNLRTKELLHFKGYFSKEYLERIRTMVKEGRREEAGFYHLEFEDQRPDPGTASAKETAAGIAKLLRHYLDMSKHFNPDTKLGLLNVSHDFVLTPFIAEVLRKIKARQGETVTMKGAIVGAGGTLKPLEEIRFSLAGNEQKQLRLRFRGQEYDLEPGLINEIADYAPEETE